MRVFTFTCRLGGQLCTRKFLKYFSYSSYHIFLIRHCGYYFFTVRFSAATTQGQLLFEGGIYSVGKPADSNDGWIRYMRAIKLGLIDAASGTHSLSFLLSAVETGLRTRTALEITQWASAAMISTRVRVPRILAAATTWGRCEIR